MRWTAKLSVDRHSLCPLSSSQHISSSPAVVSRPGKWQWRKGLSPLGDPTLIAPLLTWCSERNIPKKEHRGFKKKKYDDSLMIFKIKPHSLCCYSNKTKLLTADSFIYSCNVTSFPTQLDVMNNLIRKKKNTSVLRYTVICVMHVIC